MNILIISIGRHSLQLVERETDTAQVIALKLSLKERLQTHLTDQKIAVIFEEESPDKITIACQLAGQNTPAVPWYSINMTDDERREAGVLEALENRPEHIDRSHGSMPDRIRPRIPADTVRENFFVNQILKASDSDGTILVLLGNMHVEPVVDRLRATGHTVEIVQAE